MKRDYRKEEKEMRISFSWNFLDKERQKVIRNMQQLRK